MTYEIYLSGKVEGKLVKILIDLKDTVLDDQVNQYLKAKTKNTARTYKGSLKRFRKFYGRPISEFLKEVEDQRIKNKDVPPIERKRYFEETINEFIKWSQDLGYANNPIRGSLTALQNLFKYYDVPISFSFVNMPPPISRKSNHKHKWKIEEVKKFVAGAKSYRDKAIILTMLQSGMAVNEITSLDYGDVSQKLNSGELPLLIDVVREKNSTEFKTLVGADAVKYLKIYLGTRGELERDSPLFTKEGSEERVTEGAIQMRLRELADNVFGINEAEMNPYRPHSLRSAFRSRLTGKTDGDLIKFWMGDNLGPKAGAYLNLPDEEHKKLYSAVENRLSIETISADAIKVKSEVQDVYLKRLSQIEQENESLRNLVGNLAERLGQLDGLKERIEELEEIGALPAEKEALRKAEMS